MCSYILAAVPHVLPVLQYEKVDADRLPRDAGTPVVTLKARPASWAATVGMGLHRVSLFTPCLSSSPSGLLADARPSAVLASNRL